MGEPEKPRPRRWSWKRTLWVLAGLAILAAVTVAFLPQFLPGAAVRRRVETALAQQLGRPVRVASASFRWGEGLEVTGLQVDQAEGAPPLATARRVTVQFDPLEAARSVTGGDLAIDRVRIEDLELWLVLDKDGRLNVEDLASRRPAKVRVVQVTGATVHFENRRAGRTLTLSRASASLGELSSSGRGYVSLSADLEEPAEADRGAGRRPPGKTGHVAVTANLNRLEPAPHEPLVGSLKAEWTDVAWRDLVSVAATDSPWAGLMSRTSGRMAATFGHGAWTAEGAIEAADLTLLSPPARPSGGTAAAPRDSESWADAVLPQAILGFQVRQAAPDKPIDISLVKFSAPGVDLKISGVVRLEQTADGADVARTAFRLSDAWAVRHADLRAVGNATWVPLCQGVAPLKRLAEKVERLGGGAVADFRLATTPDGLRLSGFADLTGTLAVWRDVMQKELHQTLRLEADVSVLRDFSAADITRLELVTQAGAAGLKGHVPLAALSGGTAGRAATGATGAAAPRDPAPPTGARLEAHADIQHVESLLALVPALRRPLGPLEANGPLRLQLTCEPAAGPPEASWAVRLHGDLTGARIAIPDGAHKPAAKRAAFDALAIVTPEARRADFQSFEIHLAGGSLVWRGSAQVQWPATDEASPVGHFAGTLDVSGIESAGAVLAPNRFASAPPPVAGEARFDVLADLAEGRFQGRMKAGLEKMAIHPNDYFAKPAGQPASLTLTTLWVPGAKNHVEAEAQIELPGVRLTALGKGEIALEWRDLPATEGGPAPAGAAVRFAVAPASTLELRAQASDLSKAADVSPILKKGLQGFRTEGGAFATALLSLRRSTLHVGGSLDLTDAALDLASYLKKPCGRPMTVQVTADVGAAEKQSIDVRITGAEARLDDSVARASGWVRLAGPSLAAAIGAGVRSAPLFEEADLEVHADWRHNEDLRKCLPWLEPLYARCGLEGPTRLMIALAGTPIRGKVRLDADATACRISAGRPASAAARAAPPNAPPAAPAVGPEPETVLKPAGTPATFQMEVRYGEVPGEMTLDRLSMKLADATAAIEGRLLFDDPSLLALAPPTAWSFHVQGQVPDATLLGSLLPGRLADLKPAGAVAFNIRASADPKGAQVESCHLAFQKARIEWLGRPVLLDGPVSYDAQRLATDGLNIVVGGSDVTLVAYIADPNEDPTGSVFLRGKAIDLKEGEELLRRTSEYAASLPAPAGAPRQGAAPYSEQAARRLQRLLARARLSVEAQLDRVTLVVPQWDTTYDLTGLAAEGRLADRRFVMPRFSCAMNQGTIGGEMALDFRPQVPVLSIAYDARDLHMADNLKPFIDTTFPNMKVFGTLSTRASLTQPLAEKALPIGRGETVLTDGLLEGPGAPDYMANVLPGLKLTQYRFNRMSNVFENKASGDTDNRMIFNGRAYDIYIFGVTHADGQIQYTLGVDLSASLGSQVISRTLDQGKLPLMHYTGRIVGTRYAEGPFVNYVLPHEFAYDVFVRRNLLLQIIKSLGEKPPEITRPEVVPAEKDPKRPADAAG